MKAAGALLVIIAVLAAASLVLCDGHLIYTLDDPYITLGLASHIAHGHYGLNAGELASPSSSILYPLVMALFAVSSLRDWAPLLINSAAAAATAALIARMFAHYSIGGGQGESIGGGEGEDSRSVLVIVVLCFAINIAGVPFTGLEHSLHILTSVAIIYGLALTLEADAVPPWLIAALVLNPLWRFEGAALTSLTLLALALHGHIRTALVGFALTAVTLGAYAAMMSWLGLPVLPSSVLVKQAVLASGDSGVVHLLHTLQHALTMALAYGPRTLALWVQLLLVLLHPVLKFHRLLSVSSLRSLTWARELTFVGVIAATVGAHVLLGSWGWWYRYEIYAVAVLAAANIVLWHTQIGSFLNRASPRALASAAIAAFAVCGFYVRSTLMTPLAARGVYEQQYQMHRFAVDFYRRPVAVNDLGWVSYGNPSYVLDLWGLGSEAARRARLVDRQPGWLDQLTRSRQVGVAMIYPAWFADDIPSGWHELAVLRTAHRRVTAASDEVAVYATSPASEAEALRALHRFASQLPASLATVRFTDSVPPLQGSRISTNRVARGCDPSATAANAGTQVAECRAAIDP